MTASSSSHLKKVLVFLGLVAVISLQFLYGASTNRSISSLVGSGLFSEAQPCIVSLARNETSNETISETSSETSSEIIGKIVAAPILPPVKFDSGSSAKKERNLVVFTALGTGSAIATVHHNIFSHFLDWDCIVYMHAEERSLPSNETRMKEISNHCSLVRLPGAMWSHFLLTLTPELTSHYDHVAVVLDDLFAPSQGGAHVNISSLLQTMNEHNLSSISPAIKGAAWSNTRPRRPCLWRVHQIETFLQIFTTELFQCWRSFMKYSNPQGFCLDLCLEPRLCPTIATNTMAVDATQVAYHLGRQWMVHKFVPEDNLAGVNLSYGMRRDFPKGEYENFDICKEHACPMNESSIVKSEPLFCPPRRKKNA